MDTSSIVEQIDAEISQLQQAKAILAETAGKNKLGSPKASYVASATIAAKPAKRGMSAEGKAKVAAAQKARWAKVRKAAKKATAVKA